MNRIILSIAIAFLISGCALSKRPDPDDISRHVKSILELPTFEHIYRDVIFIDRERSFLMFKTQDAEALFAVDVRIQAGLDLNKGFSVVRGKGGVLEVALPQAEILLADADESTIEQYFLKEIGGNISRLDYYDEISRKKAELIEDAIRRGILRKAEDNARSLIASFLKTTGYDKVVFLRAEGS